MQFILSQAIQNHGVSTNIYNPTSIPHRSAWLFTVPCSLYSTVQIHLHSQLTGRDGDYNTCTCINVSLSFSLQLTLPLVEGLRSTAIRPRHWKQVLRFACSSSLSSTQLVGKGGGFDNTVLEHLTLSQLMALELHGQSYI